MTQDFVNHPKHYTSHPSGLECIDIAEHHSFCIGNAIKYLWRAGLKEGNSSVQDLEKAIWYINREIASLERSSNRSSPLQGSLAEEKPRRIAAS